LISAKSYSSPPNWILTVSTGAVALVVLAAVFVAVLAVVFFSAAFAGALVAVFLAGVFFCCLLKWKLS